MSRSSRETAKVIPGNAWSNHSLALCLVALSLSGCGRQGWTLVRQATEREDGIARRFINEIVNQRPESAEQLLLPELKSDKAFEDLSKTSDTAQGQQIRNIELADANFQSYLRSSDGITKGFI